ncbi:unnamed protein product [Calicophoron daubneyi]|uniref:Uncharacterized protein n=1 Tax=Calicophoron daubneyi TaxID=300641 RepID=A0AAV2TYD8_CALDB
MVVNASKGISSDTIKKAFECCGVAANGKEVPVSKMNHLLQNILINNSGLVSENEINPEPEHDDDGIGAGSGDNELIEEAKSSFEENSDEVEELDHRSARQIAKMSSASLIIRNNETLLPTDANPMDK